MKDQTLQDHNKKQRRDFECETHNFIRPATNGNLAYLNFECLWKHIEIHNKALLKRERERVRGVIDKMYKKNRSDGHYEALEQIKQTLKVNK